MWYRDQLLMNDLDSQQEGGQYRWEGSVNRRRLALRVEERVHSMNSHHFHAVIWIDHHEARVFHFSPTDVERLVLHPDDPGAARAVPHWSG